ncbi:hypothetical protein ACFQAV_08960 [Companilactobacillus huachuanensis]|uniref:Uncharacterized protein n=1 Tax=Companilactobacillus huachuanensis TaxID=2559914 RepID=A0ABW1RLJ5_9LACO|nr:hypothetical protein [Companilactobacillus huachuanensis]
MTTKITGNFSDNKITLKLNDLGIINYYLTKPDEIDEESIFIIMKEQLVIGMSYGNLDNLDDTENFIELVVPENIIPADFFYFLTVEMEQAGYEINVGYKMTISPESAKVYANYWERIMPLLKAFGLQISKPKKLAAKPRHKYSASLAEIPFSIDYMGSKATVYWTKRNELVIKAGANLVAEAPLTKSGVIGFAGKFGLRLRDEQAAQIENNILIADVKLRSVNEVGTFLYFAGTNSWLQLKSPEGKTLNELTVVK